MSTEDVGLIRAERDLLRRDAAELWWALRDLLDATYDGPPEVIANAGRVLAECCYGNIEEWDTEEGED